MKKSNMKIKTIRLATDRILSHLENSGVSEVELEKDLYWHLDSNEIYEPTCEPKTFTLGQLSDDLENIEEISSGKKDALGFDLVWLSALLRYVGEKHQI